MITESKVTEIFCIADDFAKNLKLRWQKYPSVHCRHSQTLQKTHDVGYRGHNYFDLLPLSDEHARSNRRILFLRQ